MKKLTIYWKLIPGFLSMAALMVGLTIPMISEAEENVALKLGSGAFSDGGEIPALYTCEGRDVSPPLQWEGVPEQTRSLVLILDDPDAPDPKAPRMTWVHWVLYNIPSDSTGLPEGALSKDLPSGT